MTPLNPSLFNLRLAKPNEYEKLNLIKIDGGKMFGEAYQMRPLPREAFSQSIATNDLTVVTDHNDTPCGFSLVCDKDDDLYLRNIYVQRSHAGKGLGTLLLQKIIERAEKTKRRAITLTTSGSAPWNAPYYKKHGFRILSDKIPLYLQESLDAEMKHFTLENFPALTNCVYCLPRVAMEKLIA